MYKAMIIDDEAPVRQVILYYGDWALHGIEEIMEFDEAASALEALKEQKPSLVFVDLNMPNMGGIEFLELAAQERIRSKFIIISGYDDFQYAKKGIELKVVDYLLKPIGRKELNGAIVKALLELKSEGEVLERELNSGIFHNISRPLLKQKLFMDMIEGNQVSRQHLGEYIKMAHFEKFNPQYGVALIEILNYQEVKHGKFRNDAFSFSYSITNVVDEMCSSWSVAFSFRNQHKENEIIVILKVGEADRDKFQVACFSGMKKVVEKLEDLFDAYCIASIGGFFGKVESIRESFLQAEGIMRSVNLLENNENVYWAAHENENKRSSALSFIDKKDLLLRAIEGGSLAIAKEILDETFEEITNSGYFSMEDAGNAAVEFLMVIDNIHHKLGIGGNRMMSQYFKNGQLTVPVGHIMKLNEFIFEALSKTYEHMKQSLNTETVNMEEIKQYIEDNFYKDLNLADFADKYYLSKDYLSRLFKDKFGFGIYEYILQVRMEKAKLLLEEGNLKIQEVSEFVGFHDNNYFSKAFKKFFGVTPSDFRIKV